MRTPSLLSSVAVAFVTLVPAATSAQEYYTVTPTYEFSVRDWNQVTNAVGQGYRSWGVQFGMVRPNSFFSPHVWFQRYTQESLCPSDVQTPGGCDGTGWSLTVGPAIRLIDRGPWWGEASAGVELGPNRGPDLNGTAGFHVGVHLGGFSPSVLTQVMRLRGRTYATLGFGLRLELHPAEAP